MKTLISAKQFFSFPSAKEILFQMFLAFLGFIVLLSIIYMKSDDVVEIWQHPYIFSYTVFVTVFQLSRILGAMLYKKSYRKITSHLETEDIEHFTPSVSFVIPCKNEEKSIEKNIRKCFQAEYPADKFEVIVINDGSTDKTKEILDNLKKEFSRLTVVHWEENRGKRHAMAEGFRLTKGEIVIQLDSDSYLQPNAIRKIIQPFLHSEIGAVCAHASPVNADKNWLTKMQAAYYFMSFRILKAAESTFLTVFCCSGCASAYRKSVILPIINKWQNETFLGKPVMWGDDRSLTNWVLRSNYLTVYADEVQAYTIVPETFKQFLKQQIRWKKSWFINSIFAMKFIYKNQPFVAVTYFLPLFLLTLMTPIMATLALIYNPFINHIFPVTYVLGIFLIACIVTLYYLSVDRKSKYWKYIFVWSSINMFFLSFILYYSLIRIQDRKWSTR